MAKIPSYKQKSRFYILANITLAATLFLLYNGKNRIENMKDNEGGITRIIKDKRIQLVQNGCRKTRPTVLKCQALLSTRL